MKKSWDSYCSELIRCPYLNQLQGMCYIDWLRCESYAPIHKLGTVSQMDFIDWKGIIIYSWTKSIDVDIRRGKWILKRSQKAQAPNSAWKNRGRQLWLLKHVSRSRREIISGRKELWCENKLPLNLTGLGGKKKKKENFHFLLTQHLLRVW